MKPRQPIPLKRIGLHCVLISCCLLAVYLSFISLISVWVGLGYTSQSGFWVPILAGGISLILVLWALLRIVRHLLIQMKEHDVVNI
jgi:hypothetical protein